MLTNDGLEKSKNPTRLFPSLPSLIKNSCYQQKTRQNQTTQTNFSQKIKKALKEKRPFIKTPIITSHSIHRNSQLSQRQKRGRKKG